MRSIMFRPDMIKAIREGRKTVTRRLDGLKEINKEPDNWSLVAWQGRHTTDFAKGSVLFESAECQKVIKPRYRVGEIVYIKEAWSTENQYNHLKPRDIPRTAKIFYLLDGYDPFTMGKVRSPMFMMEWMARDYQKFTGVRAERLQEITEEDAVAEGMTGRLYWEATGSFLTCARDVFQWYWDSINLQQKWDTNPFVWRYSFVEVKK